MIYRAGDHVRLPGGLAAEVLDVLEDSSIRVRLDGETTGLYPPEQLAPADSQEG